MSVRPGLRDLTRAFSPTSPGGGWGRMAYFLGAAVAATLVTLPFLSGAARIILGDLVMVLAPLAASAACLGARAAAAPGGRATWLLIGVGAVLASLGQALSARASLMDSYMAFPSPAFHLFIAFHIAFAEAAILALRPAHEPRLALEIALDGLLVLLAFSAGVLRFVLDGPIQQGWLSLPQGVAMLLGQFAVAASLLFVALLVFWRDTELSSPVVDGLLVSALFFAFGNFLVALGLDPMPEPVESSLDVVRLAGWVALALTAGVAMLRPEGAPVKARRVTAARRFRQSIIPAAALFITVWALDAAGRSSVTEPSLAVMGAMGTILAIRIGAAIFAVQRESEERRRAEQRAARARIRAITAQMSPHFLFNALHSLSALVRRDAPATERALERLGGLLRYGLDSGEHLVRFADEWRFARDYLDLEALRLGERLTVKWDVASETLELAVPPFVLQPLVENAIKYAVSPFPQGGGITVRADVEGERLVLEVEDTGPGATEEELREATGVGVRGVRAQLQAHFGEDGQMRTAQLPGGGFRVRVEMPADAD